MPPRSLPVSTEQRTFLAVFLVRSTFPSSSSPIQSSTCRCPGRLFVCLFVVLCVRRPCRSIVNFSTDLVISNVVHLNLEIDTSFTNTHLKWLVVIVNGEWRCGASESTSPFLLVVDCRIQSETKRLQIYIYIHTLDPSIQSRRLFHQPVFYFVCCFPPILFPSFPLS